MRRRFTKANKYGISLGSFTRELNEIALKYSVAQSVRVTFIAVESRKKSYRNSLLGLLVRRSGWSKDPANTWHTDLLVAGFHECVIFNLSKLFKR